MNSGKETIQRHSVINADQKLNLGQIYSLIFAFGALMAMGWLDNARGPIYPMILKDLNLTHSQGSLFFAAASFTAILANIMVPLQISYWGSKKILFAGVVVLCLFPLVILFSESYQTLLFAAVIFGWSMGTIGVTQNIVVEENAPPGKKRSYLSLLHSVYGLSALLAPVFIGSILGFGFSWSESLMFVILFVLPVLVFGFLSLRSKFRLIAPVLTKSVEMKNLDVRLLLFWGVFLALYVSCELFFTTRLVVIFNQIFNKTFEQANFQLILFFTGLFVGRLLVSFLPSHFSSRRVIELSLFLTSIFILMGIFISPSLIFVIGFTLAPIFPLCMDEISNQTGFRFKQYSSIIIAISSVGVVIMHLMTGLVADRFGLIWSMSLPFIFVIVALVGSLILSPTVKI